MSALTSLLVRDEVVSVRQIEDALQRQVLEGGDIDTALLELKAVPENVLNAYRAESCGARPASRSELMGVERSLIELLPRDLVQRHRVVPIARRGHALVVACSGQLEAIAARELEAYTHLPIEWRVATEVRVEAGLALHYGIDIAPRMRRLAEELASLPAGDVLLLRRSERPRTGLVSGAPSAGFDEPEDRESRRRSAIPLPPPTMVSEHGVGARAQPSERPVAVGRVVEVQTPPGQAPSQDGPVASPPASSAAAGVQDTPPQRTSLAPPRVPREAQPITHGTPRPRARRPGTVPKGPLTKASARELLEAAEERDAVVEVFFNFARQYFESTVLFAVREDRALGLESHNTPGVDNVHEVSVQFERGGTLEDLMRSLQPRVVDLARRDADRTLPVALARLGAQPCALIPVCIRQRVVSLVYGDRNGEAFRLDDIADLVELLPLVSRAFERIIRNRKLLALKARRSSAPPPPATGLDRRHSSVAPRASWSAAAPDVVQTPRTTPPRAIAGVFPVGSGLRPHEVPTPHERPRRSAPPPGPAATLAGMAAHPGARKVTSRDLPGIGSAPPSPRATDAKFALTSLGVPRSAPPPPRADGRRAGIDDAMGPRHAAAQPEFADGDLARSPTMRLPVQSVGSPTPPSAAAGKSYSKAPPGTGAYRSGVASRPPAPARDDFSPVSPRALAQSTAEGDTRPISRSRPAAPSGEREHERDAREPSHAFHSRAPAPGTKMLPGTDGLYRTRDVDSEQVSQSSAPRAPDPAGRSSNPPSSHSARNMPADVVSLPPPPRLPGRGVADGVSARPAVSRSARPRVSAAPITQPLGHKRSSRHPGPPDEQHDRQPAARDERREPNTTSPLGHDVVHMSNAVRASLLPAAATVPDADAPGNGDVASLVVQLIADLCRCGPDDEARCVESLLRHGDTALPALIEHFPGPLWFDRRKPHPRLPMGRDVSAIARAVSAFGERAWPHLVIPLASQDVETRFYATLLVSDQLAPPLLPVLAERVFDVDPQIRLLVKDMLPKYRGTPGFSEVARSLRARAGDADAPMQERISALDAIGALRDAASVPILIEANEASDRQISVPAHRVLVTITGQDFGHAVRKWNEWYEQKKAQHRVEWLIDSLMHPEQALRATAGIELQKLTQVYYGYVAAAPKRERERAQKRYLDWWQTQGKAKFA